ncbi:Translation initiation factor eIF-2B subunit gamma [Rhodotorula kratochvilovae]
MSMLPNSLLPEQLPKAQFRAVVTCGYGVDLFPLVEPADQLSSDEEEARPAGIRSHGRGHGQCKALLPVAGKKMIDWVLERIEAAGIFDILVLAPDSIAKPIAHHLRSRRAALAGSGSYLHPLAKIDLEEIPEEVATKNVVRVLMWAAEKALITTDFILAPCDLLLSPTNLFAPSISLAALLDRHRSDDNLLTTLFSERAAGNVVEARKNGPPEVLTIYDRKTSTLLDIREMDDFDEDEVPLRTSLLAKFPAPTLTTALLPTQLYIFSSLLLPVLTSPTHARRLRSMEDLPALAGWVSRLAWRNKGREQLGLPSSAGRGSHEHGPAREDGLALGRSTTQPPVGTARKDVLGLESAAGAASGPGTGVNTPALVSRSSWRPEMGGSPGSGFGAGGAGSAAAAAAEAANERWAAALGGQGVAKKSAAGGRAGKGGCKVVVWRQADGFAARGNTVAGFVEINRAALRLLPPAPPPTGTPSGVFISPDSHLHASVYPNLGEKVGIKRCIIGRNTNIGKGSKLTNCVVMENVVIGENVKLDNCVVSNGVQIRDRAALKDCEIGRDVIVDFDTQTKGEQLVVEVD